MKKIFSFVLAICLILISSNCFAEVAQSDSSYDGMNMFTEVSYKVGCFEFSKNSSINIIDVNNTEIVPFLEKDRVMVPLRSVVESFGLSQIEYDEVTDSVKILGNPSLQIKVGVNAVSVTKYNTNKSSLEEIVFKSDIAPVVINDRMFVPLRIISEILGYRVDWNDNNKTVYISNKPKTYENTSLMKLDKVTVSTAKEFLAALSSNRHIILKEGLYNLSSEDSEESTNKAWHWEDDFDGKKVIIEGVSNLIIEGAGADETEIVIKPRYADVLSFLSCNNITLKNIKAGHTIEQGDCSGGVLYIESTNNIVIDNTVLYGCGTIGIGGRDVNGLKLTNSIIEDCTSGIISFMNVQNCLLKNNTFRNTNGYSMFYISASNNITLDDCNIKDNISSSDYFSFFHVYYSNAVKVINCNITNNTGRQSEKYINNIDFTGTIVEGNEFDEAFKTEKFKDAYVTNDDFIIEGLIWQMHKSDIINLLGEPNSINDGSNDTSYIPSKKIMVYDNFNIGLGVRDKLIKISITIPGVKTIRGIGVGSTRYDVLNKYGYPNDEFINQMTYSKNNNDSPYPYLYFNIENGVVVSMGIDIGAY